jgi:hypothetical protein
LSDSNPHDHSNAQSPRDSNILLTEEERNAKDRRERETAEKETENSYKERQIKASEDANDLAKSNRNLMVAVVILTALTAVATSYQGWMNRRSWSTAQTTLGQMRQDSIESGKQFQTQLQHYDAGLGRTGLLAIHAGEQANATQRQSSTSSEELELSQRPWITFSADVSGPLTFDDMGAHLGITYTIKNIGRTPTIGMWFTPELYAREAKISDKAPEVIEQKRLCNAQLHAGEKRGMNVFPDMPETIPVTLTLSPEQIRKATAKDGTIDLTVITCADYGAPFRKSARYYTGAIHFVMRRNAGTPFPPNILVGQNLSVDQMNMFPLPLASTLTK